MACDSITLSYGVTYDEAFTATTAATYYISGGSFVIGSSLYNNPPCEIANTVTDGYYYYSGGSSGVVARVIADFGGSGVIYNTTDITSFEDCCNPANTFNVSHDTGTFSVGEVYYLETDSFTGCSTVISYDETLSVYISTSITGTYVDCTDCLDTEKITCGSTPTPTQTPTPTPTPTSILPGICPIAQYCLDTGGLYPYDGTFNHTGTYLSNDYYVGNGTSVGYLFFDGIKWCLSDTLGGACILFGRIPCATTCPDLGPLIAGPCPTITTTTAACDIVDFTAIFDCQTVLIPSSSPTPTPTITPTQTTTPFKTPTPTASVTTTTGLSPTPTQSQTQTPSPTPSLTSGLSPTPTKSQTPTPTPTQTQYCYSTSIELSSITLPGTSPSPTPTPSITPPIYDKCFTGNATFNIMNEGFNCIPII